MKQAGENEWPPRRSQGLRSRAWLWAGTLLALDQLSKFWVTARLSPGEVMDFVPGLVQLRLVHNSGAAFSLLTGSTSLLSLISLTVCVGVAVLLLRRPPTRPRLALALGFLLGGAAGNGLDRWRLGAVTDFLEFVPIHFPVFNLADVAINAAVLCFALDWLAELRRDGTGDA
jgi:signal peptidase II